MAQWKAGGVFLRLTQGIAFLSLGLLAACSGGGSTPAPSGSNDSNPDSGQGQSGATSPWTTLGTRAATSRAGTVIAAPAGGGAWTDYNPAPLYPGTMTQDNFFITMSDGVQLAASVTFPADASGNAINGKFPVILTQTGYNKDIGAYEPALGGADVYLVQHGYIHVVVDTRGTGRSEGQWTAFGPIEQSDYASTVNWAASQSWSNGSIGVYGASLLGITAVLTAEQQSPAVKAAFPIVPMGDAYRDIVFTGGQVDAGFIPLWLGLVTGLSVIDTSFYQDPAEALQAFLDHVEGAVTNFQVPVLLQAVAGDPAIAYDGAFWAERSPLENASLNKVPTFIVGGLHDLFQRGEPLLYEAMKTQVPTKMLLGPWTHVAAALGEGLPADGVPVLDHIALQWFDQYVKGFDVGADRLPNVTQFVYGFNHFVTAQDWPNPQAQVQRWYLSNGNALVSTPPQGKISPSTILQEPAEGICSQSASQWTAGALGLLSLPCFSDDNLDETLEQKYDTAPLPADLYINGPIMADLWISTTAADAGVVVRVDDVDASGTALDLTDGILTASMRQVDTTHSRYLQGQLIQPWQPFTQVAQQPLSSGQLVELQVEVFPTSAVIAAGHRLRIAVGASDFPHGLPPLPTLLQSLIGFLSVYNDATHPSNVVLPVIPSSALQ